MVAFKPGYQLHAQVHPFQVFANNGRWRCKWHVDEDQGVDDFMNGIEDRDNGYEDEAIICCRHSYKCIYIYYIQWTELYMQNPICMIVTVKFYSYKQYTNLMKVCSCIIAYVYSQWWYCADRSYAFLNMGGVSSRKYYASISDMTTTWGLRREVVIRINLPRASIEAWRMLWHLSSNGSRGWLRNWGKGYVCREVSSARITSRGNKIWQFKQWYILSCNNIIGGIATWGVYYLARIPVQIVLLNEGYHYQTRSLFEVQTGWVHWCAMTMADSLCHQSSSIVG